MPCVWPYPIHKTIISVAITHPKSPKPAASPPSVTKYNAEVSVLSENHMLMVVLLSPDICIVVPFSQGFMKCTIPAA
eukprot:13819224-Ditylum_brightwellii.AAC.1